MSHRTNGASPALRKNIIRKRQEVLRRKDIRSISTEDIRNISQERCKTKVLTIDMKTTTTLGNARPLLLALCLWLLCGGSARSQEFTVSSFRLMPNDASAFVNSVRDLNDEACALVKVEAPSDFAFSTPLGIVKRKDEVGEIWLYLPQGTKMLTLKHPVWGVLRDYQLGTTL